MRMPQFTADASFYRTNDRYQSSAAVFAADNGGRVSPALIGSWCAGGCCLHCIEVCTRFCGPTGWACCGWETRCAITCGSWNVQVWPVFAE
jgi:hypothetical protein